MMMGKVILSMREFQKENNITERCVANSKYLYDTFRTYTDQLDIFVRAMIVVSNNYETGVIHFIGGHLVVMCSGEFLDASHDVNSLPNKIYYNSYHDIMSNLNEQYKTLMDKKLQKEILYQHLQFINLANNINAGTKFIDDDYLTYYNCQDSFVKMKLNNK